MLSWKLNLVLETYWNKHVSRREVLHYTQKSRGFGHCWGSLLTINTHSNSAETNLNIGGGKSPGSVLSSNKLCTPEALSEGNTFQLLSPVGFPESACSSKTRGRQPALLLPLLPWQLYHSHCEWWAPSSVHCQSWAKRTPIARVASPAHCPPPPLIYLLPALALLKTVSWK